MLKRGLNDFFHVGALGTNNSSSNLELLLIFNLDVIAASQFILLGGLGGINDIIILVLGVKEGSPLNLFIIFVKKSADFFIFRSWTPFDTQFRGHTP